MDAIFFALLSFLKLSWTLASASAINNILVYWPLSCPSRLSCGPASFTVHSQARSLSFRPCVVLSAMLIPHTFIVFSVIHRQLWSTCHPRVVSSWISNLQKLCKNKLKLDSGVTRQSTYSTMNHSLTMQRCPVWACHTNANQSMVPQMFLFASLISGSSERPQN
ncbi:hypothetical protein DFJ77DRAFT_191596 [Powellomyces hirtus]|nr:hypothetical protein DFJ77DRAFT_191596 [Powellomyces hirtus]